MVSINMLSKAGMVKGQGVLSAHDEQVELVKKELLEYNVVENKVKHCQIMHFHTINPEYFVMIPFVKKRSKTVAYVHFLPETLENSIKLGKMAKKIFYKYVIDFYKSVDHLVVVNPYFINILVKYGIDREKITYIPNFVSSKNFYPVIPEKKVLLKQKYHIPQNKFVVLSVGQLQKRKGVLEFLEIARQMPDIHFVWAGGAVFGKITDGYDEIKEAIHTNLPDNVTFLGVIERDKMNEVYNIADMMFLPSYEELFPMTILEAMCIELPILIRDLEIYKDILFDFYMSGNTKEEFMQLIQKLKNDEKYYEQASKRSKKGNVYYSKENVSSMWREFYHTILQDKE